MKPMTIRTICALLASVMLLGTFASCATGEDSDQAVTESSTGAVTSGAVTEPLEETRVEDDLPEDLNFGGDEVVIISRYREGWTSGEIAVEKITGDEVSDSIYERNTAVEERLGITINSIEENTHDPTAVVNKVATTVKAGTHEYDILACACYATLGETLNGTFADLKTSQYINLDKPWWSQGFNEVVEYQGAQYAATGSMLLSLYRFAFVTVFNKELFDDRKIPYLYEDVKNGTWTLDRQIALVPEFHVDGINQGVQDEDGDVYGLVTNDYISVDPYWSACDVDILQKNADGEYELVFDSSKLHAVGEKTMKLFYETGNAVYDYKSYGMDDEQADIRDMFANNGAAMATLRLLELESDSIRNMKATYGVVPMPKFDEIQKEHYTYLHDQFTVFAIPTSIQANRFDEVAAVLESMGAGSHYTVRPAYYEATLRTKIAQDPESAEMLDGIISNIYIDAGIIYAAALISFQDTFRQIMGSKSNTVISSYKSIIAQTEFRKLPNIIAKLESIKNQD